MKIFSLFVISNKSSGLGIFSNSSSPNSGSGSGSGIICLPSSSYSISSSNISFLAIFGFFISSISLGDIFCNVFKLNFIALFLWFNSFLSKVNSTT